MSPPPSPVPAHDAPIALDPLECCEANHWWTVARIVSNVLHDVRNSLQVISGNAEMLLLRADLDEPARRRLNDITTQTTTCVEHMDHLHGYVRDQPDAPGRVKLSDVAATALAFRSVSLGRGGVATSLTPSSAPLVVSCPPRALLQLLLNFVLEAERLVYGREGASLTVSTEQQGQRANVVIDGHAHGGPSAHADASAVAKNVSTTAIAELARSCGAELGRDGGPDAIRVVVSLPAIP
ncbi:MAG TPA: histidine kinase dimerization/phospho-acceptor domain-containing protein [Vicinamibacterales bacterium]|nr:histidine kinase dimerization/phospho-acceptor domain-containing protein [Vicinamibacterales bacterium]